MLPIEGTTEPSSPRSPRHQSLQQPFQHQQQPAQNLASAQPHSPRHSSLYTYPPQSQQQSQQPSRYAADPSLRHPPPLVIADSALQPPRRHSRTSIRSPGGSQSASSVASSVFDLKRGTWVDLEKHGALAQIPPSPRLPSHVSPATARPAADGRVLVLGEEDADSEAVLHDRALSILLYLSAPSVLTSFAFALITIAALLAGLLVWPLRFCRLAISNSPCRVLHTLLLKQLRLIHFSETVEAYNAPALALILILSPFVSLVTALAAWTAGVFWVFTAIIGNPDGDDQYNDGRTAVLWVRDRWERWLLTAV